MPRADQTRIGSARRLMMALLACLACATAATADTLILSGNGLAAVPLTGTIASPASGTINLGAILVNLNGRPITSDDTVIADPVAGEVTVLAATSPSAYFADQIIAEQLAGSDIVATYDPTLHLWLCGIADPNAPGQLMYLGDTVLPGCRSPNTFTSAIVSDPDSDSDGIPDSSDNCPPIPNANQADRDSDGLGDVCDPDDDNDGIADGSDNCPLNPNADQQDTDNDSLGDVCDSDDDNDSILDGVDNCPLAPNVDQANNDGDTEGDVCDADDDNDGLTDDEETQIYGTNPLVADSDGDGINDGAEVTAGTDPRNPADPNPPAAAAAVPMPLGWLLVLVCGVLFGAWRARYR